MIDPLSLLLDKEESVILAARVILGLVFFLSIISWVIWGLKVLPPGFRAIENQDTTPGEREKARKANSKKSLWAILISGAFLLMTYIPLEDTSKDKEALENYLHVGKPYVHSKSGFQFRLRNIYQKNKLSYEYRLPNSDRWEKAASGCGEARIRFSHSGKLYLFQIIDCIYKENKVIFDVSPLLQ